MRPSTPLFPVTLIFTYVASFIFTFIAIFIYNNSSLVWYLLNPTCRKAIGSLLSPEALLIQRVVLEHAVCAGECMQNVAGFFAERAGILFSNPELLETYLGNNESINMTTGGTILLNCTLGCYAELASRLLEICDGGSCPISHK